MPTESHDDEALAATVGILIKTLRAPGQTGDPDAANRLAAKAWVALRHSQPRQAERINGAMHYLARLPQTTDSEFAAITPENNQEDR